MKSCFITGASGFVGKQILEYFEGELSFEKYRKGDEININSNIILHLAGKAHDIKQSSDSNDYYSVNTDFTKDIFDSFLESKANIFISLSSIKAVCDKSSIILTEDIVANPISDYGKSKLLAEHYIFSKRLPPNKRVYVLRPSLIYGKNNKGNLDNYKVYTKALSDGGVTNLNDYAGGEVLQNHIFEGGS